MTSSHFDLIVVGSGSGNSLVGPEYADKRVAIVESGTFGGTCLNVGCIPTKMFVYAAEVAAQVRSAAQYGVDARIEKVRWADIRDRIFSRIDPISDGGRAYRAQGPGTTLFSGRARFTAPRSLHVSGLPDGSEADITGDQIVVATGARPWLPPVVRDSDVPVHTSDTVMRIEDLPASMLIVGGGFVAAEFAHVFTALGVRVTLVNRSDGLLRHLDDDISAAFTSRAQEQWDVRLGVELESLRPRSGAGVHAELSDGTAVEADLILVATGRTPNSEDLDAEAGGVAVRADGRVAVDRYGRTTADGVWALGDVSSPWELKHVANHEARVVEHNLAHPEDLQAFRHQAVPSAVFTHPQIATVGLSEQQAREAGHEVSVAVQAYGDTAYGWAMEDTQSFLKLVGERRTGLLLGAHFLGPQASSMIQPLTQAMTFGLPAHEMARGQYWIHPALAEVVENALLGLEVDQSAR